LYLLGRYIAQRTNDGSNGCQLRVIDGLSKTETAQPDNSLGRDHQVRRSKAAVYDTARVSGFQSRKRVAGVSNGFSPRDGTLFEPLGNRNARNILRGHHQLAFDLTGIVKRHDVGMNQPRVYLNLAQEARHLLFIVLDVLG